MNHSPKPILRWAGSKSKILPHMADLIPDSFDTYFEPFLGSGALFFHLLPERAILNDLNNDLIIFYKSIRSSAVDVSECLERLPTSKEYYYKIRANRSEDPIEWAAEFVFLNRLCWNGLYRVNNRGMFNVPYGAPKTFNMPPVGALKAAQQTLSRETISIISGDFEAAVDGATAGDFVFFDPPYVTSHNMNGFIAYNEKIFSWRDQIRLADLCRTLDSRGVRFLVANANHDELRSLYKGFNTRIFSRSSTLAGKKEFRKRVFELLIHNGPEL